MTNPHKRPGGIDVEKLKREMVKLRFGEHPKLADKGAMEWAVDYIAAKGMIGVRGGGCTEKHEFDMEDALNKAEWLKDD